MQPSEEKLLEEQYRALERYRNEAFKDLSAGRAPEEWADPARAGAPLLPDGMVASLAHASGSTEDVKRQLVVQQLNYILDYYVVAEQGAVSQACEILQDRGFLPGLEEGLRAGARAVSRQEVAHSRDFALLRAWVGRETGIEAIDQRPAFVASIGRTLASAGDYKAAAVVFAALTEVYPPALAPALREAPEVEPRVRTVFLRHEDEEVLHRAYWWQLLEGLWRELDDTTRSDLRPMLPEMLGCHLRGDVAANEAMLADVSLELSPAARTPGAPSDGVRDTAREVAGVLVRIGVLGATEAETFTEAVVQASVHEG